MVCRYNLRKVKGSKYVHLSVCVCMCDNYHHIRLTLTLTSQLTNWNDCCLLMFAKQNPKLHMNKRDIQNKTWMKTTRPSISPLCNITGCLCMEKKTNKRHRKERPYLHTIWDWSSQTYSRYSTHFFKVLTSGVFWKKKRFIVGRESSPSLNPKKSKSSCWMLFFFRLPGFSSL